MRSILFLLLVALLACGQPEESPTQPSPSPTPAPSPPNDTGADSPPGTLDYVVEMAVADLAGEKGVTEDEIHVVTAEAVTWNDGSLGCPEPGMMYTQALVDGFRVVLQHEGAEYHYHSGGEGDPFLCPDAVLESRPGGSIPPATRTDQ